MKSLLRALRLVRASDYDALAARLAQAEAQVAGLAGDREQPAPASDLPTRRGRAKIASLEARLAEAEGQLGAAREELMLVTAKMDILEGAARVLDARTRTHPTP